MIARTLNSFLSKQGRRMHCPKPWCLPSMTLGFHCVTLCLEFPHVLTIYFVFPSWFIYSDYKVTMSCQQLCQHDFYFTFYSSLCPQGLIHVRCSHMTHRLCDWPVQSLQLSAAVIYRWCGPTCALEVFSTLPWDLCVLERSVCPFSRHTCVFTFWGEILLISHLLMYGHWS